MHAAVHTPRITRIKLAHPPRRVAARPASLVTAPATMITVPAEFAYVAGTVVASWFIHHGYMAVKVMNARKKFGVQYPTLYATKDDCPNDEYRNRYNCTQRGHQNSLEYQPIFLALLISAGLKHPITAALAGAVYLLGRVLYMEGYATGKPDARLRGGVGYVGIFTLVGIVAKWAVTTAMTALGK